MPLTACDYCTILDMQTPPPFSPPSAPPPKKSNTGLIVALVLCFLAVCCVLPVVVAGFFGFSFFNKMSPLISCEIGFEEAQQAITMYSSEHGGKLPKAATWQDDIRPYFAKMEKKFDSAKGPFKNLKTFPPQGDWVCTDDQSRKTGIAFNSELSGRNINDIKNPYATPMLFEVERTGTNLSEAYKERPRSTSPRFMGSPRDWIVRYVKGSKSKKGDFTFGDSDSKDGVDSKGKSNDNSDDN